jgi:hypothetical protein
MVLNSVLPSLLNLAQIVTILNTTTSASSTFEETTTPIHYYLDAAKDTGSYGRRESSDFVVGEFQFV